MKRFLFCLLLSHSFLYAEVWEKKTDGFEVRVDIPKTTLSLLEDITIQTSLKYPQGYRVDLERMQANLLNRFSFESAPFTLKSVQKDQKEGLLDAIFTLEPQKTGKYQLSFLTIPFVSDEKKPVNITSGIFTVEVKAPKKDPDFKAKEAPLLDFSLQIPVEISPENRKNFIENKAIQENLARQNQDRFESKKFPWTQLLGLMFLFLVYLFVHTQKQKTSELEAKKRENAKKIALQNLENLEKQEDHSTFYEQLTEIVRTYIEGGYGIQAPYLTTEEFFETIKTHPVFDKRTQKQLMEFLEVADSIKFGLYTPTKQECERAFRAAKDFIK